MYSSENLKYGSKIALWESESCRVIENGGALEKREKNCLNVG